MGLKERKQREKDIRRQQIMEAAQGLFMLKGFKSTKVEEIANKAELSPGTIYQYFADKDHLQASLALNSLQSLVEQITGINGNQDLSVEEKIRRIKEALYKTYESNRILFRDLIEFQLMTDFKSPKKELVDQNNDLYRKLLGIFGDIYEEGVRQGIFADGHRSAHADIIFGTFIGLMLWEDAKQRIDPKKNFLSSTLDRAFEIFIKGVKRD